MDNGRYIHAKRRFLNRIVFGVAALLALPALAQSTTLSSILTLLPLGTNIDLTGEGKLDWVHWGFFTETTATRKYGVAPQITSNPIIDTNYDGPYWLDTAPTTVTWSDGTPTTTATNVAHGIFFVGTGHGFQITCPADTNLATLRLYVGAKGARGRFTASLSGGGPGITNTTYSNPATGSNALFTVDFQAASPSQTLTVAYTMDAELSSGASVILQAATLTGTALPPTVAIASPTNGTVLTAPATFSLTAVASNGSYAITNMQILGPTPLAQSNVNPFTFWLSNQGTNVYVFTAAATDNRGVSVTSAPVRVFVTTGGGVLAGSWADPPPGLDLTAEGTIDWAHWGLVSTSSFDHKAIVTQQIPTVVPLLGKPHDLNQYSDNFTGYTWSDGTPTSTASNSTTGIFAYGLGDGFQLTVPATPTLRRLKVYVGAYGAQGRFEATLSDGSGPPYSDRSVASAYNNSYTAYTLNFASRLPSANLVVRWTSDTLFDSSFGNVTWQAATLAPIPLLTCVSNLTVTNGIAWDFSAPAPSLFCGTNVAIATLSTTTNSACGNGFSATRTWEATDPCGNSAACSQTVTVLDTNPPSLRLLFPQVVGTFTFSFCTQPQSKYTVLFTDSLPGGWQELTNLMGNGTEALVTHSNAPTQQRFYEVKVE